MQSELNSCFETILELRKSISSRSPFSEESLKNADYVRFYTGFPNFKVLKVLFDYVVPPITDISSRNPTKLVNFQEFMIVLAKLKLDSPLQEFTYRFDISMARIFLKWFTILDVKRSPLMWPEWEILWTSTPASYRAFFGKRVVVILDCFWLFIERPSNLLTRASTLSSYKHHNTVNVLISIVPQSVVSFISNAWGGRVSDKYLTDHCRILNHLLPCDVVLAFDISESVGMMQAKLHIPSFTKGKN